MAMSVPLVNGIVNNALFHSNPHINLMILDELWQYQDVKCDFRAEITGTGNRSNM